MFAETALEQAYGHLDWMLASWGNMVSTNWIYMNLCNLPPIKFLTWYFEGSFCKWNLLFSHTFSDSLYICVEWITSKMLCCKMLLIGIYIDYQHANQCHCFIVLLSTGGFDCSSSMLSILCKLTFPTRVSKDLVHFVVIKLWQQVHFW